MKRLVLTGAAVAIAGSIVVLSGVVPIKASSGHWRITAWILHLAMERSVATHTMFTEVPALEDPALVALGAAHYELACRTCHGSPERPAELIAGRMTPAAPDLAEVVPEWEPEELFYIVKHGVKFTGMPAWPSPHRDDEVWAVVAFLVRFPASARENIDSSHTARTAIFAPDVMDARGRTFPGFSASARSICATRSKRTPAENATVA